MKIELFPNSRKDKNYEVTKRLIDILSEYNCELYAPNFCEGISDKLTYGVCRHPDVIIVLGGDGSIMRAAHRAAMLHVPILGINLGRVGYLAEIEPSELEIVRKFFKGEYHKEKRMMISATQIREGRPVGKTLIALNDAVLSHGKVSRIVETEVYCNGGCLGRYRSDGFIVSTPTGSTAYSLSAGGPVIDPSLRGICLVPICPHSLTAKPIIVPDNTEIELVFYQGGQKAYLTLDGQEAAELAPGDSVRITASDLTTDLIRINRDEKRNFYRLLRDKMSEI